MLPIQKIMNMLYTQNNSVVSKVLLAPELIYSYILASFSISIGGAILDANCSTDIDDLFMFFRCPWLPPCMSKVPDVGVYR